MPNKQKICFITPSLQMGGMERVITLLANQAISIGYEVYIICLITDEPYYPLDNRVNVYKPTFKYSKGLSNKAKVFKYLYSSIKMISPNTVLSFSEVFNPLSILSCRLAGYPIFISDRSSPTVKLSKPTQLLQRSLYPLSDGLIVQTESAKSMAIKNGYNRNIRVIANPLKELDCESNLELDSELVVISVGRLIKSKNFGELIDIFNDSNPSKKWQLWIIGDGPERLSLQSKINNLGLDSNVKLVGAVKDVDSYLSQASIFAFTSLSEGFPNALSEALAIPLPCIAYDCPAGPADLIQDADNGFLIPLHDKKLFKNRLTELMASKKLRIKLTEKYQAHRLKYNVSSIADAYLSFITK